MRILIGSGLLVAVMLALSACGGSHRVVTVTEAPGPATHEAPAPMVKLIHSISKDRDVTAKRVEVYGPGSRYAAGKGVVGRPGAEDRKRAKRFYLIVVHGHFVACSHPAGTKAPRGTIETQVWSAKEAVTGTGISNHLPAAVFRLEDSLVAIAPPLQGRPAGRSPRRRSAQPSHPRRPCPVHRHRS